MIKQTLWIGLALSLAAFTAAPEAVAAQPDTTATHTFAGPIEIPGQVLPAGTYAFTLLDSMVDRHVVQISTVDGARILATVMAIPHYRLDRTNETLITYGDTPTGAPQAIRAWFHPNNTVGHEFVYPRDRAVALAKQAHTAVPSTEAAADDAMALRTAPIVTVEADEVNPPVAVALQPPAATAARQPEAAVVTQPVEDTRELPRTASSLPLLVLFGIGSIFAAMGLMVFGRQTTTV
ncbi:MAG: hypothetical protein Q8L86_13750 [Vicinamibacterales bacterium]|nr:hypothetical protein [Vicinamibacterales bacterium]